MEENQKKEYTYEELKTICSQLSEQNRILMTRVQQNNQAEFHKWVEYLFRVIEHSDKFSKEFVSTCASNLEAELTPKKTEE